MLKVGLEILETQTMLLTFSLSQQVFYFWSGIKYSWGQQYDTNFIEYLFYLSPVNTAIGSKTDSDISQGERRKGFQAVSVCKSF